MHLLALAAGVLRIVGGLNAFLGRLELLVAPSSPSQAWRTMCDDGWRNNNARVVCRQMGFAWGAIISQSSGMFTGGTGNMGPIGEIILCSGTEAIIQDCRSDVVPPREINDCLHMDDVGVMCSQGEVDA